MKVSKQLMLTPLVGRGERPLRIPVFRLSRCVFVSLCFFVRSRPSIVIVAQDRLTTASRNGQKLCGLVSLPSCARDGRFLEWESGRLAVREERRCAAHAWRPGFQARGLPRIPIQAEVPPPGANRRGAEAQESDRLRYGRQVPPATSRRGCEAVGRVWQGTSEICRRQVASCCRRRVMRRARHGSLKGARGGGARRDY